jgi:hypothetical protein
VFPAVADDERFLWRRSNTSSSLAFDGLGFGPENGIVVSSISVDGRSAADMSGLSLLGSKALLFETCLATALVTVPEYE